MAIVEIPHPCTEDYLKMARVEQGFHCQSCKKDVVDFRQKSDEEVADFLSSNQGQKSCGRFRISQIVRQRSFSFQILRFAAAILLVFGSILFTGCNGQEPEVMGEMCVSDSQMFVDSMRYAREYQLMLADSARIADSVAKTDTTK